MQPAWRKYYNLGLANAAAFRTSGGALLFGPRAIERGFENWTEIPRLVIGKDNGSPLRDFEQKAGLWLISPAVREMFEELDPGAFDFRACIVEHADGSPGPQRWLCDITRVIDALDEEASDVRVVIERNNHRYYSFSQPKKMVFKSHLIEKYLFFRMKFAADCAVCAEEIKLEFKARGFKGASFDPVQTI